MYNWITFTLAIKTFDPLDIQRKTKRQTWVNYTLPVIVWLTFMIYLSGFLTACLDEDGNTPKVAYDVITWTSLILP